MDGFITLHRKITKWEWYTDANTMRVFIHCLLSANYEENDWRGIHIERGQFITSVRVLSLELGLTPKQIGCALNKLKATNEIVIKTTNKYSVITICNYASYQDNEVPEGKTKGQTKVKQRENEKANKGQQLTITNNNTNKQVIKSNTDVLPKSPKFDIQSFLIDKGVEREFVDAWLQIRKNKRATNSEAAMDLIDRQIQLAGITWNEAVQECVLRNWIGFKADWWYKDHPAKPSAEVVGMIDLCEQSKRDKELIRQMREARGQKQGKFDL